MLFPSKAFTLIELLIVVAIIAILAAIAVPNFLEAQIRAKVSRVHADMRTVTVGLEAYFVDANRYPPGHRSAAITSPISYLTSMPIDVFGKKEIYQDAITQLPLYHWTNRTGNNFGRYTGAWGVLQSWGPVGPSLNASTASAYWARTNEMEYDPTNGTVSDGRIVRFIPGNLKKFEAQ